MQKIHGFSINQRKKWMAKIRVGQSKVLFCDIKVLLDDLELQNKIASVG